MNSTDETKVYLGLALFGLAFVLKLVVGRMPNKLDLINALIELPVSCFFLTYSLFFTYCIKVDTNAGDCFIKGILYFAVGAVVLLLWRLTQRFFTEVSKWWIVTFFINLLISVYGLYFAIGLLLHTVKSESPTGLTVTISSDTAKGKPTDTASASKTTSLTFNKPH